MNEAKPIKIGMCTVRNEEKGIQNWAEMLRNFCERVVVLLDPATTDKTEEILTNHCDFVEIEYQDRSLGDSDNATQGPEGRLIMHENKTKWINENVADGDWFLEMAVDEEFHFTQWEYLLYELQFAFKHNFDALVHRTMYEPVNVNMSQLEFYRGKWCINPELPANGSILPHIYSIDWGRLHHARFQKKYAGWEQKSTPHSGFKNKAYNPLYSQVPIWHWHRVKYNTVKPTSWRDKRGSISGLMDRNAGRIPLIPIFQFNTDINLNVRLLNQHSYKKIFAELKKEADFKAKIEQERLARAAAYKARKEARPKEWQ